MLLTRTEFERRRAARVQVALTVEIRHQTGFALHSTRDISSSGCFFDRSMPLRIGERVELTFTIPGETEPVNCTGEVVNVPDTKSYGMGVRFLDISVSDAARLDDFARVFVERQPR